MPLTATAAMYGCRETVEMRGSDTVQTFSASQPERTLWLLAQMSMVRFSLPRNMARSIQPNTPTTASANPIKNNASTKWPLCCNRAAATPLAQRSTENPKKRMIWECVCFITNRPFRLRFYCSAVCRRSFYPYSNKRIPHRQAKYIVNLHQKQGRNFILRF